MRKLVLSLFAGMALTSYSQVNVVDVGKNDVRITPGMFYVVGGTPMSTTKYVKVVDGSPYFNEAWMKGKLVLPDGRMYDSLTLRLDLAANELQYKDPNGNELIATTAVKAITLIDSVSGEQYHFVNAGFFELLQSLDKGWYQLLVIGKASMTKKISKDITETRPYGQATVEQTINTTNQYFLVVNNVFTRVKKLKEMTAVLKDKKSELDKFINDNHLSGKSDSDFSLVLTHYNKLVD